jgi:hypothetical protein
VTQAAVLGTGTADLVSSEDHAAQVRLTETVERFAQDMRAVLGSFGWDESMSWPILVLSDGGEAMNRVVESLNGAGLPAKVSLPDARALKLPAGFKAQDIYEYRTPLGLSLIALERPSEAARQHQALLKTVARHRPDVLGLLTALNAGKNDGIVLDSLHFKKGQPVTIAGQAGNTEQMWAFEKNLRAQKDMTNVAIVNPTQDSKTKKIKFTITFSYKGFSRKDAVL